MLVTPFPSKYFGGVGMPQRAMMSSRPDAELRTRDLDDLRCDLPSVNLDIGHCRCEQ